RDGHPPARSGHGDARPPSLTRLIWSPAMSRCRIRVAAAAVALLPALALGTACNEMFASSPGERLWRRHCAECHGVDGSGNTPRYMGQPYADLRDGTWSYGGDRASIENVT